MTDTMMTINHRSRSQIDTIKPDATPASNRPLIIIDGCPACTRLLTDLLTPHGFQIRLRNPLPAAKTGITRCISTD